MSTNEIQLLLLELEDETNRKTPDLSGQPAAVVKAYAKERLRLAMDLQVVRMAAGMGPQQYTEEQLAAMTGCTKQRIGQVHNLALRKIHRKINRDKSGKELGEEYSTYLVERPLQYGEGVSGCLN